MNHYKKMHNLRPGLGSQIWGMGSQITTCDPICDPKARVAKPLVAKWTFTTPTKLGRKQNFATKVATQTGSQNRPIIFYPIQLFATQCGLQVGSQVGSQMWISADMLLLFIFFLISQLIFNTIPAICFQFHKHNYIKS